MNKNSYTALFDAAAREHIPDTIDLAPRIITHIEKKKGVPMQPRLKILAAVLTALLLFTVLMIGWPTAARAMQRFFAYFPGVGVVDPATSVRQLAAPVSQTRGGVTVTVKRANASTEITTIDLDFEGVPASAIPTDPQVMLCSPNDLYLRYPDGTRGELRFQAFIGLQEPAYWTWYFDPVPGKFDTAVLVVPCIPGTKSGAAPENWELQLRFVPASTTDFAPVVFPTSLPTQPAATPTPTSSSLASGPSYPRKEDIVLALDKVVRLPDGDVFSAHIRAAEDALFAVDVADGQTLTDINGQDIPQLIAPPDSGMLLTPTKPFVMDFKTDGPVHGPVKITVENVQVDIVKPGSFSFDAGPHPQVGQQWQIGRKIEVGGRTFRVTSATLAADGYHFVFGTDSPDVLSLYVFSMMSDGSKAVSSSDSDDPQGGPFHVAVQYQGEPPSGIINVEFYVTLYVHGPWQVTWQPELTHP